MAPILTLAIVSTVACVVAKFVVSLRVKVLEKNVDIRLTEDPSFKDVIRAFALLSQIVGDASSLAKQTQSTVGMPPTPGSGLPPVNLP